MLSKVITRLFGSRNDRTVARLMKRVEAINAMEASLQSLSDDELGAKTKQLREQYRNGKTLDALLPEAFAVVREASQRTLGLRHYDVQLVGGMVLHEGRVAEMKTGEGKTLMATLAVYLNALAGEGVHVVTVNDYLARRDAEWMRPLYSFLGMKVGAVVPAQSPEEKREAYSADITYATNNELGFDYLRDNMAFAAGERYQRKPFYAIVDEVDSILIDEARTPLIISGPTEDNPALYHKIDRIAPGLKRQEEEDGEGDFHVDEKAKQVHLSEAGMAHIEEIMVREGLLKEDESLYDSHNLGLLHHINAALRAHHLFQREVDYIVRDNQVVIVDEFTGRTLAGRRWSDGLHQAVEAKEGVPIQKESQTLASITFQNYFRLYDKLAGMTGTADTEAYELQTIYGLEVVVIPTHRPLLRKDMGDLVYLTAQEKYDAIIEDIKDCHERGQPTLVGTTSIEVSELLSKQLKQHKIPHEVLNAKQHEREATIVAKAGMPGAATIATNMAGRGTDIVLGGNLEADLEALGENASEMEIAQAKKEWQKRHDEVLEAGGLHIIGTERHESRRIDNQLRGRSGRQGDPGSSRFYLSLQDSLMRIFASDRMQGLMHKLGMKEGEAIEHPWVSRAIENAQRKVESHNFDIRKNLLEYDDVANEQRKVIYVQRNDLMEASEIEEAVAGIREDVLDRFISRYVPPQSIDDQWDVSGLEHALQDEFGLHQPVAEWLKSDDVDEEVLRTRIHEALDQFMREREVLMGHEQMRELEKRIMLYVMDTRWKEHLGRMDYLRKGIQLRAYGNKQPKQEFKKESFAMFEQLLEDIKFDVVKFLARVQVRTEEDVDALRPKRPAADQLKYQHEQAGQAAPQGEADSANASGEPQTFVRDGEKVGRNEPCPCGSGKKYKHCHGRLN
jgi:preprotein translocase subunit SecA